MRQETQTKNIYQWSELPEETQEAAIENWRQLPDNEWFTDEAGASFEKFAGIFSIDWRNINYEEPYRNEYSFNFEDNILDLTGQRLATYIWNNYKTELFKGKYYGKLSNLDKNGSRIQFSDEHPAGQRHIKRYSKCQLDNSCVMTGVCYDDDLLTPIYEFLNHPENINIEELLNDCINSLCKSVSSEIEYQNSDEGIREAIEANDYEFTENGEIY